MIITSRLFFNIWTAFGVAIPKAQIIYDQMKVKEKARRKSDILKPSGMLSNFMYVSFNFLRNMNIIFHFLKLITSCDTILGFFFFF